MRFIASRLGDEASEIFHDEFGCSVGNAVVPSVTLNFGTTPLDSTEVKALKIRNGTCNEESYQVHRDPTTNPLDAVFHFDKYSWNCDPGGSDVVQARYEPSMPNEKCLDYFTIVNGDRTILRITATGASVGPKVSVANDEILMVCSPHESARNRVKLVNESSAEATFAFDVDLVQNSFEPCPAEGSIGAHSSVHVVITFQPKYRGYHVVLMPCLIQHQAPILLRLYGYCGKQLKDRKVSVVPTLVYPSPNENTFKVYMSDCNRIRKVEAASPCQQDPISLSVSYIDFGRFDLNGGTSGPPRTTSFTNHAFSDVLCKWHEDVDGIFSFSPNLARVKAGETCLFEVQFHPREENIFYEREFQALVFYLEDDGSLPIFDVSMIASLRVIGHTFPADASTWIPQYDVPRSIVMPPCLPSGSAYKTFLIKKSGHLPIMYRFIPPDETSFTVKPMQGVVQNNHRVIVVEMCAKKDECLHYERWAIRFNGNPNYETFVDFRGYADQPRLKFDQTSVQYPSTHANCERVKSVLMMNPSRHHIDYRFVGIPTELRVDAVEGKIYSNEILTHNWTFCPVDEGHYELAVTCCYDASTRADNRDSETIMHVGFPVLGRCERGYLLAKPSQLIFDQLPYDEPRAFSFELTNPGDVEIPYLLAVRQGSCEASSFQQPVQFHPISGNLLPGDKQTIRVTLVPREPGHRELSISYCVRKNFQIDPPVPTNETTEICSVKYLCRLPVIKIDDLLYSRIGNKIGKYVLWRLLNISKLNRAMNELQPGESDSLEMHVPPMLVQDDKSIVELLISNSTCGVVNWSLKRMKNCSCCSTISGNRKVTARQSKKFDCPHRGLTSFHPETGTLEAQKKSVITMELSFKVIGETTTKWDLEMGYGRHVYFSISTNCLSGGEKTAFPLYGSTIELEYIYIGDRDPVYQICWLYNPTGNNVSYSFDTTALKKFNERNRFEIFDCSNPSGIVAGLSCEPVIVKFQPRRLGIFQATFPLTIDTKIIEMTIRGECTNDPLAGSTRVTTFRHDVRTGEDPVYFNTDTMDIPPMPLHTRATRMIMIHNRLEHELVAYKWKRYTLPGLLEIDLEPATGRIQPESLQTFRLIVTTGGKPCSVDADVTCEFINQSKKRAYERSVILQEALCDRTKDYFTITEGGTTFPKAEKIAPKEPEPFYKVLTVRCYSYNPRDEELKIETKERLKNTPPIEINVGKRKFSVPRETTPVATFMLEGILRDIVQDTDVRARSKSVLKYSQIGVTRLERTRIQERSYDAPCARMIEKILENMIFIIVHEEFALDTIHLTRESDVRQATHLKIWQRVSPSQETRLEQSSEIPRIVT